MPPAPPAAERPTRYSPELRAWKSPYIAARPRATHVHKIIDKASGACVATLRIDKAIDNDSAMAIACLVCAAPRLWFALREEVSLMLTEDAAVAGFVGLVGLLHGAANRAPFGPAVAPEDDVMMAEDTAATAGSLAKAQGVNHVA